MSNRTALPTKRTASEANGDDENEKKKALLLRMEEPPTTINKLPTEVLLKIFGHLSAVQLCKISLVNCRFKDLTLDPSLWTQVYIPPAIAKEKALVLPQPPIRKWPQLKTMHIEKRSDYNALAVLALQYCPQLEVLELVNCPKKVTKLLMEAISRHGRSLHTLNLDGTSFEYKGFYNYIGQESLNRLKNLRLLNSLPNPATANEDITAIFQHCKNLVCLDINVYRFFDFDNQKICQFLEGASSTLTSFNFDCKNLSEEFYQKLGQCRMLDTLVMNIRNNLTIATMQALLQLPRLESLKIIISDEADMLLYSFASLSPPLVNLTKLDLEIEPPLNDFFLEDIKTSCFCSIRLTDLRLKFWSCDVSPVSARSLLQNCQGLKHLELDILGVHFTANDIFHSTECGKELTCLDLKGLRGMNDQFLKQVLVKRCPKLEVVRLSCWHQRVTHAGVKSLLTGCLKLRALDVGARRVLPTVVADVVAAAGVTEHAGGEIWRPLSNAVKLKRNAIADSIPCDHARRCFCKLD